MNGQKRSPGSSFAGKDGANGHGAPARGFSIRGVGGWLLFYVLFQCLGLLNEALNFPFWHPGQHPKAAFIEGLLIPAMLLTWIALVLSLALILCRKRRAVKCSLVALAMKTAVIFLQLHAMWGDLEGAGLYLGLPLLCFPVLINIAWMAYFLRSRRVAETLTG